MTRAAAQAPPAQVTIRDLSKSFPGTKALDSVDLTLQKGEIHALLGGNGSGKSTLIKILAGVHQGDTGVIDVNGNTISSTVITPSFAEITGCRFVHQQGAGFIGMTVAENLFAGHRFPRARHGGLDWRSTRRQALEILRKYRIDAAPDQPFAALRPAARQMVCIARAMQGADEREGVLVLDEPTASLPPAEANQLIDALRRVAASGQTILYVSHRLEELPGFADRATVLKDGTVSGTVARDELTHNRMVELITGGITLAAFTGERRTTTGNPALRIEGLRAGPVQHADLSVRAGEIVGISGLAGSGRSALLRAIFGDLPHTAGTITLNGATVGGSVAESVDAGIALVPENRLSDAAFAQLRLDENLVAASLSNYRRYRILNYKAADRDAAVLQKRFLIKASSLGTPLAALSGGNQQKAILARWMHRKPLALLLDEPSQGVDIGARAELHSLIKQAAAAGAAVLVVSSDVDELAQLCDRVVGMVRGRTTGEIAGSNLQIDAIEQLAYGGTSS